MMFSVLKEKRVVSVAIASVIVLTTGCATSQKEKALKEEVSYLKELKKIHEDVLEDAPEWYLNPPASNTINIYGVATATSSNLHMAVSKAKMKAEYEAAKSFSQVVSGKEKSYSRDLGDDGDVYTENEEAISKLVSAVDVAGISVEQQLIQAQGAGYRVYLLAKLNYQAMAKARSRQRQSARPGEIDAALLHTEVAQHNVSVMREADAQRDAYLKLKTPHLAPAESSDDQEDQF